MGIAVGYDFAKEWSDAHEHGTPGNGGVDMEMDLKNNQVGLNLSKYCSGQSVENTVIDYVNNGWLNRIVNGSLTVTDSSGRL